MPTLIGKKAPAFSTKAVIDGGKIVDNFSLDQFIDKKYVVLFFYTKDFSGICPSELYDFQERIDEFNSRGVEVIGCSTDSEESHQAFLNLEKENGGIKGVTYPIISDNTKTICSNYGTLAGDYELDEENQLVATGPMISFRGLFLIDKKGVVQHQLINHFTIVRDVKEVLRVVDALKYFEEKGEFCPISK